MAGIGGAQFMQKGIAKIKEATEIDTQVTQSGSTDPGRYDAAVATYLVGIDYFNHALKCESFPPARNHPRPPRGAERLAVGSAPLGPRRWSLALFAPHAACLRLYLCAGATVSHVLARRRDQPKEQGYHQAEDGPVHHPGGDA